MIKINLETEPYNVILWNAFCKQGRNMYSGSWFYDEVKKMEIYEWCQHNTEGVWNFEIDSSIIHMFLNYFYFEFENELDAVAFKLKWA